MDFLSIEYKNDKIYIIDQRYLPLKFKKVQLKTLDDFFKAISKMKVRGAPLIGVTAAYGLYYSIRGLKDRKKIIKKFNTALDKLLKSRPTAYNLFWALNKIKNKFELLIKKDYTSKEIIKKIREKVKEIHKDDINKCKNIGINTQKFIKNGFNILTHCNAGSLATSKYGTALSGIYIANEKSKNIHVWVDETRPWLQGARLTSWELEKNGINNTLIVDSASGLLMRQNKIDLIIVGADRIARNGDVANKIGTYNLSVLAKENNIPFLVAAPTSTIDKSILSGDDIEIEKREQEEVLKINGEYISQKNQAVYNPVFDITPFSNITAIITENGVIDKYEQIKN